MKRDVITIDQELCNGCGECIIGCPEGALRLVDGKARLVSDFYCDGLGACIGKCPVGAITIEKREAADYDERAVAANIAGQGIETLDAHLKHLDEHGQKEYLKEALDYLKENNIKYTYKPGSADKEESAGHSCPGSRAMFFDKKADSSSSSSSRQDAQLRQWPVQLHLLNPQAPYFNNADILVAADCVPFAYPNFHSDLLKNKIVIIFCPKLDHSHEEYLEKLTEIFSSNNIKSVTVAHMEVPCCFGTESLVKQAVVNSGKNLPISSINISVKGEFLGVGLA